MNRIAIPTFTQRQAQRESEEVQEMSATLCWTPEPSNGGALPDELKYVLGRKLCDTDGTIGHPVQVDEDLIPYLEGLRDAKVKGAAELIAIIKRYGKVTLTWEH